MKNPYRQSAEADQRFLAAMLTRYGTLHDALFQIRRLKRMGEYGQHWYTLIESKLAILLSEAQCK
jgi:hypothetical protein